MNIRLLVPVLFASLLMITACSGGDADTKYPQSPEYQRKEARGKLTGDGLSLFGGDSKNGGGGSPIGVNSFLWRATLDTLAFMPLSSADPFGGVIITDWYEDPKTPGERFKVNALILDQQLRADGIKITLFKQRKDVNNIWQDADVNTRLARDIEDTILTRARQLRVSQGE